MWKPLPDSRSLEDLLPTESRGSQNHPCEMRKPSFWWPVPLKYSVLICSQVHSLSSSVYMSGNGAEGASLEAWRTITTL